MKKRYFSILLVVAFFVGMMAGGIGFADNDQVRVWINGKILNSDPAPRIIDGRVFVPLRSVADYMGASVGWDASTSTAYIAGHNDPLAMDLQMPEEMKWEIKECIDLLREEDPQGYYLVGKYVKRIILDDTELTRIEPYTMTVHINKDKYKTDKYWWAAALVHEAKHSEQDYLAKNMTREERETEAWQRDVECLTMLSAPQWMINYQKEAIKTRWWEQY